MALSMVSAEQTTGQQSALSLSSSHHTHIQFSIEKCTYKNGVCRCFMVFEDCHKSRQSLVVVFYRHQLLCSALLQSCQCVPYINIRRLRLCCSARDLLFDAYTTPLVLSFPLVNLLQEALENSLPQYHTRRKQLKSDSSLLVTCTCFDFSVKLQLALAEYYNSLVNILLLLSRGIDTIREIIREGHDDGTGSLDAKSQKRGTKRRNKIRKKKRGAAGASES